MKIHLPLLLILATCLSAVPSDINYQGRLTDANGDAVTGDVTMNVKMYDAQSGGNEIYSEDIGTVTLDENGVYSFQFGASGNSTVTKTETIVTSDGTSTEYTGTFTSTPIDGTISVTDETYSWNDVDGNPGEQATAYIIIINGFVIFADIENGGSGYDDNNPPLVTITGDGTGATATATVENGILTGITITGSGLNYTEGDITIAPPPAPFTVDKVDGNLEVGYGVAPIVRTGVVATYKTLEPSIIGALSEASSHWLELTVDGTAQNPRERILSVPFAQVAGKLFNRNLEKINDRYENINVGKSITLSAGESVEVLNWQNSSLQHSPTGSYNYHQYNICSFTSDEGIAVTYDWYPNVKNDIRKAIFVGPGTLTANRDIFLTYINGSYLQLDGGNFITLSAGESVEVLNWQNSSLQHSPTGSYNYHQYNICSFTSDEGIAVTYDWYPNVENDIRKAIFVGPGTLTANRDIFLKALNFTITHNINSYSDAENIYENSTFSIVEGSFSWEEAKVDAESRGGRLAVLDTDEKLSEAYGFLNSLSTYPTLWIGLSDSLTEGHFRWINGVSLDESVSNWNVHEPSNGGEGEDHVAIWYSTYMHQNEGPAGGTWNDFPNEISNQNSSFELGNYLLESPNP